MNTTSLLMAYIGAVNLLIDKHNRLVTEGCIDGEDCDHEGSALHRENTEVRNLR